jgi:hypothetical protein
MLDLGPYVGPLVTVVGILLIIAGALALVMTLVADVAKLVRGSVLQGMQVDSLSTWVAKLPERYFVPTVVLMLGVLLADPHLFATYSRVLFGSKKGG